MKTILIASASVFAVSGAAFAQCGGGLSTQAGATRTVVGLEGPAAASGFTAELLGLVPLDDQIDGMAGWNLRTRRVTFQPGGIAPVHPHERRPTLFFIIEGEVVEYRSDTEEPQLHKAGDAVEMKHGAAHWWKNESDAPAVVLATDIVSDEELSLGKTE